MNYPRIRKKGNSDKITFTGLCVAKNFTFDDNMKIIFKISFIKSNLFNRYS